MLTVLAVLSNASHAHDTITLDENDRHRRRIVHTSDNGLEFLLDLPEARLLMHGEALELSNGRIIEVRATPEHLYRVTADGPRHLLALAWQIGNRHLPAQIASDHILIRRDAVIKKMLEGLGAKVEELSAPFNPEGGAYDGAHNHQHDHN